MLALVRKATHIDGHTHIYVCLHGETELALERKIKIGENFRTNSKNKKVQKN